ncbi:hypothetical protein B0H10DRAFT_1756504, partial [Mycena sp. CBHHK59/15]
EEDHKEMERKKPKQKEFNAMRKVGDTIAPQVSPFALDKRKNFKNCDAWYFTQEGCADATEHQHSVAEETFGLAKTEEGVALHPLASSRPLKNVVKDKDLTWRQFSIAKNTMLLDMQKYRWSDASLKALATFWLNLELHPQHIKPHGEKILLTYQAKVRLEWDDTIKMGDGGFDISEINESLMQAIADNVWDEIRHEGICQVS